MTNLRKRRNKNELAATRSAPQTLREHLRELQARLVAVAVTFLVIAAAAYPFFDKIAEIITAPLKDNQELVYLTPGGAIGFVLQVCVYVGLIGALPVIIFHSYRFIMPAIEQGRLRMALGYTLASLLLAACGIVFAYIVSLPAALYFLTSFDIANIKPMLTIDSYFSFVMTYLLAGAALFQLPLVMMIINKATPLTPSKMMRYQKHIILGSFIIAAIITPTPDPLNQTLLAAPVVVMYQLGIILVWMINRKAKTAAPTMAAARQLSTASPIERQKPSKPVGVPAAGGPVPARPPARVAVQPSSPTVRARPQLTRRQVRPAASLDGMRHSPSLTATRRINPPPRPAPKPINRPSFNSNRPANNLRFSIDGMVPVRR